MAEQRKQMLSYRNLLALSLFSAILMVVGGVDIYQAGWAYPGLIGSASTTVYEAFGVLYAILGAIYLIFVYALFKRRSYSVNAVLGFAVLAIVLSVLWLPGSLLDVLASIGVIYYATRKEVKEYVRGQGGQAKF